MITAPPITPPRKAPHRYGLPMTGLPRPRSHYQAPCMFSAMLTAPAGRRRTAGRRPAALASRTARGPPRAQHEHAQTVRRDPEQPAATAADRPTGRRAALVASALTASRSRSVPILPGPSSSRSSTAGAGSPPTTR